MKNATAPPPQQSKTRPTQTAARSAGRSRFFFVGTSKSSSSSSSTLTPTPPQAPAPAREHCSHGERRHGYALGRSRRLPIQRRDQPAPARHLQLEHDRPALSRKL